MQNLSQRTTSRLPKFWSIELSVLWNSNQLQDPDILSGLKLKLPQIRHYHQVVIWKGFMDFFQNMYTFYLTRPSGPCQVKEYKMTSEQSLLTGWLANYTDCQPHFHVCLNMEWTSVWSFFWTHSVGWRAA